MAMHSSGQFWNIPIHVTPFHFTGPVNYDLQNQELYLIEVEPQNSTTRRFVAEYYPRSWDPNCPEPCLYAGDQQGDWILEIKYPNDPVIENNYRLYHTQSLFGTSFIVSLSFSRLSELVIDLLMRKTNSRERVWR